MSVRVVFWYGCADLCVCYGIKGTGEHGVGIGKKKYLVEELGQGTVNLMKTIKRAVDPLGLFNPGKASQVSLIPLWH